MDQINLRLVFIIYLLVAIFSVSCGSEADCQSPSEEYVKTGPNSKYFYNPEGTHIDFPTAKGACQSVGLEMAEVQGLLDLNHLANFTKGIPDHQVKIRNWALGVTDEQVEGEFTDQAGSPMQFQAFYGNEPNDADGRSDCVELTYVDPMESAFAMFDVPCAKQAYVLCQWPKSSSCYYNSPTNVHETEHISYLGETSTRRYFVSNQQKSWADAMTSCANQGKHLADFSEEFDEVDGLFMLAQDFIHDNGLHIYNGFWSSGKYDRGVDGENFRWETTGIPFMRQKLRRRSWDWMVKEPRDNTGKGLETCIAYFAPNLIQTAPAVLLSASSCALPYYFMCYSPLTVEHKVTHDVSLEDDDGLPDNNSNDTTPIEPIDDSDEICFVKEIPTVSLSKPGFTPEEALELAVLNGNFDLGEDRALIKLTTEWEGKFVKVLADLTKKMCPDEQVPRSFINIMKNFFLIYVKNINNKDSKKPDVNVWRDITKQLLQCLSTIDEPIHMTSEGNAAHTADGQRAFVPEEIADLNSFPRLDLIIETFWFMFQLSVGTCYPQADSKTSWLVKYLFNVKNEFLDKMMNRWMLAEWKSEVNYGTIVGDLDLSGAIYNLRVCSTTAHIRNNIMDRLIARPVILNVEGKDVSNERTGEELHPKHYN